MSVYDEGMQRNANKRQQYMTGRAVPSNDDIKKEESSPEPPVMSFNEKKSDNIQRLPDILSRLMSGSFEKDSLLIAALLIMLIKEKADMKLILALAYIII